MAENDVDSGSAVGTAGSPTPQDSTSGSASSGSFDAAQLQSLIEGFGRRIEEIDARTRSLQGDKDRGVNETKKEVKELKAKIAEYEKLKSKGLTPDDALDEMDFRSTVRQLQEQLGALKSVSAQSAGNGAGGADQAAQAVINELKLDANSADVVSILSRGLDPEKQELELRRLATRPRSQPSAAESATIATTEIAAPNKDTAALIAKVGELQLSPTKNKAELQKLYAELDKRGWK